MRKKSLPFIMPQHAETVSRQIGAKRYLECSALTGEGVDDVFEAATRAALLTFEKDSSAGCCTILWFEMSMGCHGRRTSKYASKWGRTKPLFNNLRWGWILNVSGQRISQTWSACVNLQYSLYLILWVFPPISVCGKQFTLKPSPGSFMNLMPQDSLVPQDIFHPKGVFQLPLVVSIYLPSNTSKAFSFFFSFPSACFFLFCSTFSSFFFPWNPFPFYPLFS